MVFFVHSEEALQDSIRKWTRGRLHPHRRTGDADIGQRQSVQSLPSDGSSPPTAMLSAILPAPPHLYATARRLAHPLLPSFLPHLPWTIDLLLWDRNLGVVQSFFGGSVQSVVWFGSMKERRWLAWPAPVWDSKLGLQSGLAELQFSYGVVKLRVKDSLK